MRVSYTVVVYPPDQVDQRGRFKLFNDIISKTTLGMPVNNTVDNHWLFFVTSQSGNMHDWLQEFDTIVGIHEWYYCEGHVHDHEQVRQRWEGK